MTILAPSRPKENAKAFPIPDDAPVIITTLSFFLVFVGYGVSQSLGTEFHDDYFLNK